MDDFARIVQPEWRWALHRIGLPSRWLIDLPRQRARTTFLEQPLWRWFGIVAVLGAGLVLRSLCGSSQSLWAKPSNVLRAMGEFARPISLMIVRRERH